QASSRASSSAPTPTGPPSLCPETVSAVAPQAPKSTGTWPTACTASVWNGTAYRAASSAISATGWTVPTSLLAHITLTRATRSPYRSSSVASASTSTLPSRSTGSHVTLAPSCVPSQATASSTAWCSTALASTRSRRG